MKNVRLYGDEPHSVAVLHGGPGAIGTMSCVAKGLCGECSVVEPLQTAKSVMGQVEELHGHLLEHNAPFVLVGHSWGAWLAILFASKYRKMVKHIILIGCPPLLDEHANEILKNRLQNLDEDKREEVCRLINLLDYNRLDDDGFERLGKLMDEADTYCAVDCIYEENSVSFDMEVYNSVWKQASKMRKMGELLRLLDKVKCKTTFLHGKNDPHPYERIQDVLNERGFDFEMVVFDKCGHTPWKEKHARESFFKLLKIYVKE